MFYPNDRVLYQKLGAEAVLLHLDTEQYYGLDETGNRFWEVVCEKSSLEEALPVLLDEYSTDSETIRQDLSAFISELVNEKLLLEKK